MSFLSPRAANKRSLFVQQGKHALLGVAVLLGLSVVGVAMFNSGEKGGRVVLSGSEKKESAAPVMVNPRYYGVDKKNRPFTVTAKTATQNKDGSVAIESVQADMLLNQESWLALTATKGMIHKNNTDIELMGAVNMFYEGGYEFRSEYVKVLTNEGRAMGNQPVEGQGPSGIMKAQSFDVTENGQRLYFKGNVHVTLYLN
jgi:lipopolysaccharide export system protein LptC